MDEAKKVARPIVHTEFVCPCCGGVASTVIENGNISARMSLLQYERRAGTGKGLQDGWKSALRRTI